MLSTSGCARKKLEVKGPPSQEALKRRTAVALSSNGEKESLLKYIIAGSVLATCVGNMFVMRSRLRSISKWRAPTSRKSDSWAHPSPSNMYENAHVTKENLRGPNTPNGQYAAAEPFPPANKMRAKVREMNPRQRDRYFLDRFAEWKKSNFRDAALRPNFVPGSTVAEARSFTSYLRNLKMRTDTFPSIEEVKGAYRAIAVELHPDSNPDRSDKNQETYTAALTRAKEAQEALITKLRFIEKCPRL
jgi:hypothetical protein